LETTRDGLDRLVAANRVVATANSLRYVRYQPHIHFYREGESSNWAEPIDWYDLNDPLATLAKFLEIIHTRFPNGYQADMF